MMLSTGTNNSSNAIINTQRGIPTFGFKSMTSINSIAATTKQNINKPNIIN